MFEDVARSVRGQLRLVKLEAIRLGYALPGSPYKSISEEDARVFAPVLAAWRPKDGVETVLLRWLISEWCNYQCPYCDQTHARHEAKRDGFTAHGFDNFPVEDWIAAIDRHFAGRGLSVVLTGGEPFVDRKAMPVLLGYLTTRPGTACIRIDTNAWWKAEDYRTLDKSKIVLMCTLHPSQTAPEAFFARIDALLGEGFRIGMVNYVMNADNIQQYRKNKDILALKGIPLHPNPLWGYGNKYRPEDLELLRAELSAADFAFRSGLESPRGMKCLFPSLAYEMDYTGRIHVGCHPATEGSLFDRELPRLFAGPVPCPYEGCVCLDKYSFLGAVNRNVGLNPLAIYGQTLRDGRGMQSSLVEAALPGA
jgi:hypothetical protein